MFLYFLLFLWWFGVFTREIIWMKLIFVEVAVLHFSLRLGSVIDSFPLIVKLDS